MLTKVGNCALHIAPYRCCLLTRGGMTSPADVMLRQLLMSSFDKECLMAGCCSTWRSPSSMKALQVAKEVCMLGTL